MSTPFTLLDIAGVQRQQPRWADSVLLIIDAQKEYAKGKVKLWQIEESLKAAQAVLEGARKAGAPVIHVLQHSKVGSPIFDPSTEMGQPCDEVKPIDGEIIVTKTFPSSFFKTDLAQHLEAIGRKHLIVIGYMTHMCVSTTVRDAIEHGYMSTIVADATTTRDLPDGLCGSVSAETIKKTALAELNDRFASIVQSASDII